MADVVAFLFSFFQLLLLPAGPRIDVSDHAVEELAQVVILVQVAGVASEVSQYLAVAEPLAQDLPGVRRHAVVNQLECRQQRVGLDLLADTLDNMLADFGVLTHCVLVEGILLVWTALIVPIIGIFSVALCVGVFDVLPDRNTRLATEFLEVFVELVSELLKLAPAALV